MKYKYSLMILTASILALTSSLLTALGMAELFQGLFVVFLVIDLGRFLVLNFIIDEWKNLRSIKWVITAILAILFMYSAVGVYNKLNSMIPNSIQTAMIEAASYNKAQSNANTKQSRSENLADIAQQEYQKAMQWNTNDYDNCMKRANGNPEAENTCNNTKRRLDRNASTALKQAMKDADTALDNSQHALDENVKNQSEIAGVLTTVCRILPNTDCKTYEGLQMALTVIILLTICGLDYLQLCIVLAVNTRKNKKQESLPEDDTPDDDPTPTVRQKKVKRKKQKEEKTLPEIKSNTEESTIQTETPVIQPVITTKEDTTKIIKKTKEKKIPKTIPFTKSYTKPFSSESGFYK